MTTDVKEILIEGLTFPASGHRVCMVQCSLSFSTSNAPFMIADSEAHTAKIDAALSLALKEQWANIVVFPEMSTPLDGLASLIATAKRAFSERDAEASLAVVCLPIEHIPIARLPLLCSVLTGDPSLSSGDDDLETENPEKVRKYLFKPVAPSDEGSAFVNLAVILLFSRSESGGVVSYFIQPKRHAAEPERGGMLRGVRNYRLSLGNVSILTAICFDVIGKDVETHKPIMPDLLNADQARPTREVYLLAPHLNPKPLHEEFQHALHRLYDSHESLPRYLRVVSPNVAPVICDDSKQVSFGQSWLTTCLAKQDAPKIGI